MKREYIRDKRSPVPKSENVSRLMSANKPKKTAPEVFLRKLLRQIGVKGMRYNLKTLPGRPDIAIPKHKVAIFINGCFWHRCPICDLPLPKTNRSFWKNKFQKNVERDKKKGALLKKIDWKPIVVWECQIKDLKKLKRFTYLLKKLAIFTIY